MAVEGSEPDAAAVGSIDVARRDMYRRQVLGAAEVEFGRNGFANTKMSSVAKAADLSLATVYKHFAGKAEIWDHLHAERMSELLARVEAEGRATDSALERILTGVASVAGYLIDHPAYLDMSLWAGTAWAAGDRVAHGVQESVWSSGLDTMATGVERAVDNGEIPPIDPRVAAGLIVATLQVWLASWSDRGRVEDPAVTIDAMTQRLRWTLAGPGGV